MNKSGLENEKVPDHQSSRFKGPPYNLREQETLNRHGYFWKGNTGLSAIVENGAWLFQITFLSLFFQTFFRSVGGAPI